MTTRGARIRKIASVAILTLAVLLVVADSSSGQPRRRSPRGRPSGRPSGRVFVNVGPFWGRPHPGFVYAPAPVIIQPSPVFVQQQPVIVQQPPVVVQQQPVVVQQEPSAAAPQEASAAPHEYWYYCLSAEAFYPTAPSCPEAWIMVPARPG